MSVVVPAARRTPTVRPPAGGWLPEPGARPSAHAYPGKRVRDDVREGVMLMVFSATAAVLLAVCFTVVAALVARSAG